MFHWQLAVLFNLFITTICIVWPLENKDSNTCFQLSGSDNGDAKCLAFCRFESKTGGSCNKKRCVCNNDYCGENNDQDENNNKGKESKTKDRSLSFSRKSTSNIYSRTCQLQRQNMGKSNGSPINELCVCSK
jgi:hypothetical protein